MIAARFLQIKFNVHRTAFYLCPDEMTVNNGDYVLIHLEERDVIGQVLQTTVSTIPEEQKAQLKSVIRVATAEEVELNRQIREEELAAEKTCKQEIVKRNLPMKLLNVSLLSDRTKITFYFIADRRVDFRDLVKGLAGIFKMRIELRQVGVRDEAKRLDGYGPCGSRLCCSSFLKDFAPITLKMARDQHISLTPSKISGVCGRLLCCLEYEHEVYREKTKLFPVVGSQIKTIEDIILNVQSFDIFKDAVVGLTPDGVEVRVKLSDIKETLSKE